MKKYVTLFAFLALGASLFSGCTLFGSKTETAQTPAAAPSIDPSNPTVNNQPSSGPSGGVNVSSTFLTGVWANDGGDKVTRDEQRATKSGASSVYNRLWDGSKVKLFAAKNEVVSFNLVLEAGTAGTNDVAVTFNTLTGPGNFHIQSSPATGNGVFSYVNRNIELFQVRYLQIKGLSRLSYESYDERHIPARFRRPFDSAGTGSGTWNDRPDHDKFYPDIAVPLETVGNRVSVPANGNQSVWADIFVPKNAPAGIYSGKVTLSKAGASAIEVPVELEVRSFTLPDVPSSKTMVFIGYPNIAKRYSGEQYPNPGSAADLKTKRVRDRHFLVAHRHKISLIDANQGAAAAPGDRPRDEWLPRLDGSLFTAANGYDGPGVNTGNGVFSIGTYGSWGWKAEGETGMRLHTDAWENWFQANSPSTERFLYLIDESSDYVQIEQWNGWVKNNPGPGKNLKTFVTLNLLRALANTPNLSISATWFAVGDTAAWNSGVASARAATPPKGIYMYNGKRPANGSFATEDDGVALRELAWAQYKKNVDRWYYWEATYYNDYQGGRGETNVFQTAATFSGAISNSASLGQTGWNHSNGDGLLFYPGTDTVFPAESLGLEGPVASLRLKHWRRGIQDVDYIALAHAVNPALTQAVVNRMVPKALWDYGIANPSDPTYVRTDISWSIDPEDWEQARADLANIIEGKPIAAATAKKRGKTAMRGRTQPSVGRLNSLFDRTLRKLSSIYKS